MATQDEIEKLYVSGPNSILGQDKRSLSEILGGNYNFDKPIKEIKLDLIGLMCIPPANIDPEYYYKEMLQLNKDYGFKDLS